MVSFAVSLAKRIGVKLPRGCKSSISVCRAFLDTHAGSRAPIRKDGPGGPGDGRPPSEAMLRYARSLAEQRGIPCPPEAEADFDACRCFLDAHGSRPQQRTAETSSGGAKGKKIDERDKRRSRVTHIPRTAIAQRRA